MSISPEDFQRNAEAKFAEGVARLRAVVEAAMQKAYDEGDPGFFVHIPDSVNSLMVDVIVAEYSNWNITQSTGNERQLNFKP